MGTEIKQELELIERTKAPKPRLQLLLDLSLRLCRSDPRIAIGLANEALLLAHDLEDRTAEAKCFFRIGYASGELADFTTAIQSLIRSAALYDLLSDPKGRAGALHMLGTFTAEKGELVEAANYFHESLRLRKSLALDVPSADSLVGLGITNFRQGKYASTLDALFEALRRLERTDDPLRNSIILSNIASVYLAIGDYDQSLRYNLRSLALARELHDQAGISAMQLNIGSAYQQLGKKQLAKRCYKEALDIARTIGKRTTEVAVLEAMGQAELQAGRHKSALERFEEAIAIAKKHRIEGFAAESIAAKGSALLGLKQYKAAIECFRSVLRSVGAKGHLPVIAEAHAQLAKAYEGVRDLKHAVQHYQRFIALNEELNSQAHQRAIAEVQVRIEIEKADKERERYERETTALKKSVEERSKELTALALQIVEKNEFLADLREEITPAVGTNLDAKRLISRINDHIQSDQDWDTFEDQFKKVHSDFLRTLSGQFPELTPTELKICALMKLDLSSKEIAELFCLSIRTVENHRQRIRKKLGLTNEENLVSYLSSL